LDANEQKDEQNLNLHTRLNLELHDKQTILRRLCPFRNSYFFSFPECFPTFVSGYMDKPYDYKKYEPHPYVQTTAGQTIQNCQTSPVRLQPY
jgi:hypothetical protein